MDYGWFGKPFGGFIGPGFAKFPAFPATKAFGFGKAIPETEAIVTPFGKPFVGKPFAGKPFAGKPFVGKPFVGKPFGKFWGV